MTSPIPRFDFRAPAAPGAELEVLDLVELQRRLPSGDHQRVHRLGFHTLTLVTGGTGEHMVDFVTYPCRPGTLLWVRPGQVQRFAPGSGLTGPHVLFTPAFPPGFAGSDRLIDDWRGPTCRQLGTSRDYASVAALLAQLSAEAHRDPASSAGSAVSRQIQQLLLATILLQASRLSPHGEQGHDGEVYGRFRAELERSYQATRLAEDYAARLGYSVKTLSRACLAATGQPVKRVIDGRVVLEARRLLAHTGEPVAVIARRLGFSEPTNFGKFFTRHTGTTPGEFRATHRA
ncbi:helix-turn-helix transcriptional regulator [Amycolatopsis mediterranei]|uniref:helix-turn-helix domain-containing protein n=1 Tax=Amycolatopsis mediterranei TaxID=33910 RepID=UPI0034333F0D